MGHSASVPKRYDYSNTGADAADNSHDDESNANNVRKNSSSSFSFASWTSPASRRDSKNNLENSSSRSRSNSSSSVSSSSRSNSNNVRGVDVPILTIPSIFKPRYVLPRQLDAPLLLKNPIVDYKYNKLLGKGSFSIVQKATCVHGTVNEVPPEVAIKEVNLKSLTSNQLQNLQFEMNVLSQLHHPSVVALYYVYRLPQKLFLVMEYLRGGELLNRVSERRKYTEADAINLIRQILDAVAYIHACDVIHRDLKPENLIMQDHSVDSRIKIVDFGLCMIAKDAIPVGGVRPSLSLCGTRGYVSPEVIRECKYSAKCDMWAIGVISFILLSGQRPFSSQNFEQTLAGKYSTSGPQWKNVSEEAKGFISQLLTLDDEKRASAEEALKHPWMEVLIEDDEYDSFPLPGEEGETRSSGGSSDTAAGAAGAGAAGAAGAHSNSTEPSGEVVGTRKEASALSAEKPSLIYDSASAEDAQEDAGPSALASSDVRALAAKSFSSARRTARDGSSSRRDLSDNLRFLVTLRAREKFRRSLTAVTAMLRFKRAGTVFRARADSITASSKDDNNLLTLDNIDDDTLPANTMSEKASDKYE